MTLPPEVREGVRLRAGAACEYCGGDETGAGGPLTVDHYRPKSQGGTDAADSLVYCGPRCNQYKADYWPLSGETPLWNPREEGAAAHFLELADGSLHPLTPTGEFTLRRLRLNRPALVDRRLRERRQEADRRELAYYRALAGTLVGLLHQQFVLLEEQRNLLEEHQRLLRLLLRRP